MIHFIINSVSLCSASCLPLLWLLYLCVKLACHLDFQSPGVCPGSHPEVPQCFNVPPICIPLSVVSSTRFFACSQHMCSTVITAFCTQHTQAFSANTSQHSIPPYCLWMFLACFPCSPQRSTYSYQTLNSRPNYIAFQIDNPIKINNPVQFVTALADLRSCSLYHVTVDKNYLNILE